MAARHPGVFRTLVTDSTFADFGLPSMLLKALEEAGYATPTPIQTAAIPELMKGRDLLALAQTGTGKTAAFALPVMAVLSRAHGTRQPKSVRALILAPTRELVHQIGMEFDKLSFGRRARAVRPV